MFETDQSLIDGLQAPAASTRHSTARSQSLGCVVVGSSDARGELLQEAARQAGWQAGQAVDPLEARKRVIRQRLQMVVIDLESSGGSASQELKALAEQLSRQRNLLLVLCGNEGNALEEIWARQLGAWLYLPGVTEDSDLTSLFRDAGTIVSRREPQDKTASGWTPPTA